MNADEMRAGRWVVGSGLVTPDADPFPLTPPTAEEQARVASDAALLSAAADRLERQIADGRVDQLFTELVAWLRDAAQEAEMIGPNRFAVALAHKVMREGESA